jgi:uncharacterized protein (DUF1015 family)
MARIYPFRAWRYNPSTVRLDDVVTQPYDKISPAMQQAYYQRSPFNLVRIILGLPELFDAERGESVYTRAARDFRAWREQEMLVQEKDPCIFAYSQRFKVPGTETVKERRGFIALGKLHDYAEQVVFRHEQTLSKPKSDRLNLLKATHAHFGQIFMLYSDPARSVERILYDENGPAEAEVTDEYGVLHRLWRVSDPAAIRLLTTAMDDKKLIIADGHHRYETALNYSREHAQADTTPTEHNPNDLPEPAYPEAAVMMTFVNMDSDGLVILPTHRVVSGLPSFSAAEFQAEARKFFNVEDVDAGIDAPRATAILQQAGYAGTALLAVTSERAFLLHSPKAIGSLLFGSLSLRQQSLDVVQLHKCLLEGVLKISEEAIRNQQSVSYCREASDALSQVQSGKAQVAFLMNPVRIAHVRDIAFAGEVLPQKSTDFYPKLLSGLTIYALE